MVSTASKICKKCKNEIDTNDNYCGYCGSPLKIGKKARRAARTASQIAVPAVITAAITLIALAGLLKLNYYMPPAAEARDTLSSMYLPAPLESGQNSKLIESAEVRTDDHNVLSDIADTAQYIPPSVDELLSDRGWKIEFVPEGTLSGNLAGYCNIITKTITVEYDSGWTVPHTTLHEIGHAVDFECGFLSLTTDFTQASQEEGTWSAYLCAMMNATQADVSSIQRFAQAFAHYTMHPEDREDAPRLYEWFDENIF